MWHKRIGCCFLNTYFIDSNDVFSVNLHLPKSSHLYITPEIYSIHIPDPAPGTFHTFICSEKIAKQVLFFGMKKINDGLIVHIIRQITENVFYRRRNSKDIP